MQTKKQSFIEACTNTAVGFGISLASSFIIFPMVGIAISWSVNVQITVYYTVISVARSYVIRRWFTSKSTNIPTSKIE